MQVTNDAFVRDFGNECSIETTKFCRRLVDDVYVVVVSLLAQGHCEVADVGVREKFDLQWQDDQDKYQRVED